MKFKVSESLDILNWNFKRKKKWWEDGKDIPNIHKRGKTPWKKIGERKAKIFQIHTEGGKENPILIVKRIICHGGYLYTVKEMPGLSSISLFRATELIYE